MGVISRGCYSSAQQQITKITHVTSKSSRNVTCYALNWVLLVVLDLANKWHILFDISVFSILITIARTASI